MENVNKPIKDMKAEPDTPPELARELLKMIDYNEGDRWYEPFRGKGAFYDAMPEPKDWAEIEQGRDFFKYLPFDGHCEHIATNPPFQTYIYGKWTNGYIPALERSMQIATKSIGFLISHKIFNALTPNRLQKYYDSGWALTKIKVVNVKKWFGGYYFIVFEKDKESIIDWELGSW